MEVTRRDMAILAGFAVVLAVGAFLFVRSRTAPPDDTVVVESPRPGQPDLRDEVRPPGETPSQADVDLRMSSGLAPGEVPPEYAALLERGLFEPLIEATSQSTGGGRDLGDLPNIDIPAPATQAPLPPPTGGDRQVPVAQAPEPPEQSEQPGTGGMPAMPTPPPPPVPTVAITGWTRQDDGLRVVVEEPSSGRSKVVRVGDEAFGYRILAVSEDSGTVRLARAADPMATTVEVKVGDNKQIANAPAAGQGGPGGQAGQGQQPGGGQPGGPPGGGGGGGRMETINIGGRTITFDPDTLPPEARARYEEWRRSGGGGGRGGGGRGGR